jgi:microcystin-dependent protein
MPPTVIRGTQLHDSTVQRVDLDTVTVGQAVVAKIVQGTNVTLSSTGADSGTGDVTINVPTGAQGPPGVNACTTNTTSFTIPPVGQTVQVTLTDASWVVIGQMLVVSTAGGSSTASGTLQVTAKTGNLVTLLNPVAGALPIADTTKPGLVNTLSGSAGDYIGGDNACHSAVMAIPTGTILEYGGSSAPTGFLMCIGGTQLIANYPALYAVVGTTYGGDGSTTFGIPDKRGRVSIGAGQGTGLTNRVRGQGTGATWGEETHVLVDAELSSHQHTLSAHTHTMGNHTHAGIDHLHSLQGHTHGMDHYHTWGAQGSHAHTLGGHVHSYSQFAGGQASGYNMATGGGFYIQNVAANTAGPSGGSDAAATPAGNTVYASQTNAGWANTGGPSSSTTGAADRSLTTGGPSTNTTAGPSSDTTSVTGSDTGHNTMPPFLTTNFMIKT